MKSALAKPRRVPDGVARWFNGLDPDDLVTMGKALTAQIFAERIENKADIDNGPENIALPEARQTQVSLGIFPC